MPDAKITPEIAAEMAAAHADGVSFGALAKTYGVSKSIAHRHVTREKGMGEHAQAVVPLPAEPGRVLYGESVSLERREAERVARIGRAPGQPVTSVLEPREWLEHQVQLAQLAGDRARLKEAERILREWLAG